MKFLAKQFGAALVGGMLMVAAPAAHAQVRVNVNVGAPVWGPPVPPTAQYYYIPEIDGYYDLYTQQYLVFQDGYWVVLPELYGYDPYQFHPVVIAYRGREPWGQRDYYHSRYAYRPYQPYGPGRGGYYEGANRPGYAAGNRAADARGYDERSRSYGGSYGGQNPGYARGDYDRGSQRPAPQSQPGRQQEGGRSYEQGRREQGRPEAGGYSGGGRGESRGRR